MNAPNKPLQPPRERFRAGPLNRDATHSQVACGSRSVVPEEPHPPAGVPCGGRATFRNRVCGRSGACRPRERVREEPTGAREVSPALREELYRLRFQLRGTIRRIGCRIHTGAPRRTDCEGWKGVSPEFHQRSAACLSQLPCGHPSARTALFNRRGQANAAERWRTGISSSGWRACASAEVAQRPCSQRAERHARLNAGVRHHPGLG
jgi:hypothetical protein